MESVGYRSAAQRVTIVNTSVLGADPLLGVKYVLTGQALPGLEKTALPVANGKSVYRNPYALPLAFSSQNDVNNPSFDGNSFAYQEAAYSQLLGKKDQTILSHRRLNNCIGETIYLQSLNNEYKLDIEQK